VEDYFAVLFLSVPPPLASGYWTPTKLGLRSFTRRGPMPTLPLAPTFVEDYFAVNFLSVLPPLSKPIRCLSLCYTYLALQLVTPNTTSTSTPAAVDPTEQPWSPLACTCCSCTIYSPRISLADNLSGSMLFAPFRGMGILRLCLLLSLGLRKRAQTPICSKRFVRFEAIRIIWHQRLGHMRSRRVTSICLKAKLHKDNMSTTSTRMVTYCNQGISTDFGLVAQSS
jgi:hypothetical protein